MKKKLIFVAIFIMFGTITTLIGLTYVDNRIYSLNNTNVVTASVATTSNQSTEKTVTKIIIPPNATDIEYSYNNRYYTYLLDGKIYINSLENGQSVKVIEENSNICYYKLLYDKNLIMYFTSKTSGQATDITLKNYEISSDNTVECKTMSISNFAKIKDLDFSPLINVIYFCVETKTGNATNDTVYRMDLLNRVSKEMSNSNIDNLLMLQHSDKLYYTSNNEIYADGTKLKLFSENVELIGIDYNDNVYFLSKGEKRFVYKVYNNKIVNKVELEDKDVVRTYCNNESVYLIYSNYIIDITSDKPNEKIGRLSNYVIFDAIKADMMYLRTKSNDVIRLKLVEPKTDEEEQLDNLSSEELEEQEEKVDSNTNSTNNNKTTNTQKETNTDKKVDTDLQG